MGVAASPVEEIFRTTFPARVLNYELREQQIKLARQVERALLHGTNLLAEAGTGTGKSFAYLVPLALYLRQNGGRGVVSTATIALQEQLVGKDLPLLEATLGLDLKVQLAKGKGNYLCLVRLGEATLFPTGDRLQQIREWSERTATGDRGELPFEPGELWGELCADDACPGRKCHLYQDCFYFRARHRLQQAGLIVCNHALFFIDLSMRSQDAALLPDYQVVVLDEAQHVEEVARRTMSTEVSSMRLPVLLYRLRKREGCHLEAVQQALALNERFFATVAGMTAGDDKYLLPAGPELADLGKKLLKGVEAVVHRFDPDCVGEREHALLNCLERYNTDLEEILAGREPGVVRWVEKSQSRRRQLVTLRATPLEVAATLAGNLFEHEAVTSVIMTSATLSIAGDFTYIKEAVGCSRAMEVTVESPFDYGQQCLLYIPQGLPDPRGADFYLQVGPFIEEILRKTKGRAFVLFTSYKGMQQVWEELAPRLPWRVLKQGEQPRQRLLEEFKQDLHSVLFATASFWEGVDVQGEALSCVILVKLPFAVPADPITRSRIQAIERSGGNPFWRYTLPQAIIRFRQGFGRLIRSKRDRGLVAVLDPRLRSMGYGRYFLQAIPSCRVVSSLDGVDF